MKKPLCYLGNLGALALDIAFPRRCLLCGAFDAWWCNACQKTLQQQSGLKVQIDPRLQVWARWELNHELQHLIHALKYRGLTELAPLLAESLAKTVQPLVTQKSIVVPVPLHRARHRKRGYNQCDLLAQHVGQRLSLTVHTAAVHKVRATQTQVGFTAAERHTNLTAAFAVQDAPALHRRDVILLDDLCTTGSTLLSLAQAVRVAQPRSVQAVVLGYTPKGFQQQTTQDSALVRAITHDVL